MTEKVNFLEISALDKQLETLYKNKPLSEPEVKTLCDKVLLFLKKPC